MNKELEKLISKLIALAEDDKEILRKVNKYLEFLKEPKERCSLCGGIGKIVKGGSFGGSTEIERCSCQELKFPTNEKELKEFDEKFKDFDFELKGDEIDPNKIIEEIFKGEIKVKKLDPLNKEIIEIIKKHEQYENKSCKKCGRMKTGKPCECRLI